MINELQSISRNLYLLLSDVGEKFWSSRLRTLSEKDPDILTIYDIKEVLSWYGGMGSINDVYICGINGHEVSSKDEEKKNNELDFLRDALYSQARLLEKEFA